MADTKVTGLAELTTVATADIMYIVDDPGGTPASKKVTVENVQTDWHVGARAYNSGNLTIATSTATTLTFDSERYDTDTIHSTVANTGRLTATTGGVYVITGSAHWASNGSGVRILFIQLNGGTDLAANTKDGLAANAHNQFVSTIYELSATDYVTLEVYQTSGGNLDVQATGNKSPEFSMTRIG